MESKTELSSERIAELREKLAKATGPEWRYVEGDNVIVGPSYDAALFDIVPRSGEITTVERRNANANLIVSLRNHATALIDEIVRRRSYCRCNELRREIAARNQQLNGVLEDSLAKIAALEAEVARLNSELDHRDEVIAALTEEK